MSVFGSEASQKAPGEGPGISSLFIREREQAERPADRAKTPGSAPDADANRGQTVGLHLTFHTQYTLKLHTAEI